LTLSAKALVLAHLSSSSTQLRTLSLLFTYMTTLARYDLTYEVRDRARFLKGLLASAGIGLTGEGEGARLTLSAEDFAKGVEVDDQGVVEVEERTMSSERVRRTLFEGKTGEATLESREYPLLCLRALLTLWHAARTGAELGTLSLALPGKRFAFNVALPPFPSTVPPSTIRDTYTPDALKSPPSFNQSYSPDSRSSTPLQGFGTDSRGSNGRGRASPVVLVPTSFAAGESEGMSSSFGGKKGFVDLEDFYASAPEQEMEGEEESEAEDDSGEESEEDEEDEEESEEDESEEEEDEGGDDALLKQQ
jgi:AP-3 complex subunit beta